MRQNSNRAEINRHKTVSANRNGVTISYTDSCKHYNIAYEKTTILASLQKEGNKINGRSYQRIGQKGDQYRTYRAALYGLGAYSKDQIQNMTFEEKNKISINQKKVQRFLDKWKQEICHKKIGSFLTTFFKRSQLASDMAYFDNYYDEEEKNTMSFKDLNISKDMIIHKLITNNLLPSNYYELA